MVRRGEVWWAYEPDRKPRPYCVVSRQEAVGVLTSVLAAPATTRRRQIRTEVPLDSDDGMPKPCVLALDNLTVLQKAYLTERITTLSPARMHQVCEALHVATGC